MLTGTRVRFLALALLTACGAADRVSPASDGGARPEDEPDGGARPDGGRSPAKMYVHTADVLYTVDDATFDLVEVGPFELQGFETMNDLAVTPAGEVYGLTETRLWRIDRTTAAVSFVAPVAGNGNVAMTFLPDGSLLAADKAGGVRRVEPGSGAIHEIGEYGGGYGTAGDLVAVADGTMYTIADDGPNGDELENNALLEIDPVTGALQTRIGGIGYGGVWGTAYANGNVYAFTNDGEIIEIDRATGVGTLVRHHAGLSFYGAGVTPLVDVE